MRRLHFLLALALVVPLVFSCQDDQNEPNPDCKTAATIRNLNGACGFVLELGNGQRLEPSGPLWQNYAKHDGERVTVSYTSNPSPSNCMIGDGVKLTCIQQIN